MIGWLLKSTWGRLYSFGAAATFFYYIWINLPIGGLVDLIITLVLAAIFGHFWPLYWLYVLFF